MKNSYYIILGIVLALIGQYFNHNPMSKDMFVLCITIMSSTFWIARVIEDKLNEK